MSGVRWPRRLSRALWLHLRSHTGPPLDAGSCPICGPSCLSTTCPCSYVPVPEEVSLPEPDRLAAGWAERFGDASPSTRTSAGPRAGPTNHLWGVCAYVGRRSGRGQRSRDIFYKAVEENAMSTYSPPIKQERNRPRGEEVTHPVILEFEQRTRCRNRRSSRSTYYMPYKHGLILPAALGSRHHPPVL